MEDASAARQAFETSDRIARALFRAADQSPVLVLLDDLHWADDATLRTLRHVLAETSPDTRLVVVATRRAHPEPTGALAEVGEAFARRHALRLDLAGLGTADARALVRSVAGAAIADDTADAWQRRAAGNPFFLVELARLDEPDAAEVPATVRDVVTRRLTTLPERALDTLRLAAVAGRRFQAATITAARRARRRRGARRPRARPGCRAGGRGGRRRLLLRARADPRRRAPGRAALPAGPVARADRARAGERPRRYAACSTTTSAPPSSHGTGWRRDPPTSTAPGARLGPRPTRRARCRRTARRWSCARQPSRRTGAAPTATRRSASRSCSSWLTTRRARPGGPPSSGPPSTR